MYELRLTRAKQADIPPLLALCCSQIAYSNCLHGLHLLYQFSLTELLNIYLASLASGHPKGNVLMGKQHVFFVRDQTRNVSYQTLA